MAGPLLRVSLALRQSSRVPHLARLLGLKSFAWIIVVSENGSNDSNKRKNSNKSSDKECFRILEFRVQLLKRLGLV